MNGRLPRRAERLASWSLAPWERVAVLGDLAEEFHEIQATRGERAAHRWYWRQTIASIWPNVLRRLKGDERRRKQLANSGWNMAWASFMVVLSDGSSTIEWFGISPAVLWLTLLFTSALGAAQALFSERVQMLRSQLKIRRLVAAAGLAFVVFVVVPTSAASRWIMAWGAIVLFLEALRLWPRWRPDAPPTEIVVGVRTESPAPDRPQVLTKVPNIPLGLSDLVLCRPTRTSGPGVAWLDQSTIQRTFGESQSFRVCGVVNVGNRPAAATVDLVDSTGRVARHLDAPIDAGALAAVPRTWDDLVDVDPADHFGTIDATVELRALEAGRYSVRLTVTDGERTSVRAEPIVVSATGRSA